MSHYEILRELEAQGIDLLELLSGDRPVDSQSFFTAVNRLKSADDEIYSDLLQLLTTRRFSAAEARELWRGILKHKNRMTELLGANPGVRLAALDYLGRVRKVIRQPRLLDRRDFEHLEESVITDELTGLYNRRFMKGAYQREIRRARRYAKALTVMLIDIDRFKNLNDTYGHALGDQVLVAVAGLLREVCRETDIIGRFGGDEIVVLLPETRKQDAFTLAERVRSAARDRTPLAGPSPGQEVRFSLSIGLATYPDDSQETAELLEFADRALYQSKERGRDTVSHYGKDTAAERDPGKRKQAP
ncbi:MAG: GGDEF domain-containing protein [Planctomycetes bacterium]|nr:GGDEF domain-containing protein [Planctomycetota bacterium]